MQHSVLRGIPIMSCNEAHGSSRKATNALKATRQLTHLLSTFMVAETGAAHLAIISTARLDVHTIALGLISACAVAERTSSAAATSTQSDRAWCSAPLLPQRRSIVVAPYYLQLRHRERCLPRLNRSTHLCNSERYRPSIWVSTSQPLPSETKFAGT